VGADGDKEQVTLRAV